MASCLREVQIDTRTLLLNQCLFLLLFFGFFFFSWLDFVYSFPAKILCTLETLKLKAQVALLPFEMRILKKKQTNKCRCVFPALLLLGSVGISSWVCPTGFLWGWGPWGQLSSPSWAHQELQINFSLYHVSPVKCSLYPLAVSKGSSAGSMYAMGKGLAPYTVHTVFLTAKHGSMQQNLRQWEGCFGEQDRPQKWQTVGLGWLGGGRSAQLPFPGETSLFWEGAGRQMAELQHWALWGCIISPTVLDADTHVGGEPLLRLAPVAFMPWFFCSCC